MTRICVVLLCNKAYYHKFLYTCKQLLTLGKYTGEICLVIGDDLKDDCVLKDSFIQDHNIRVKHFPDIHFDNKFLTTQKQLVRPPHWFNKLFQFHKLHLFNTYFKQWDYIFYIDCGVSIFSDIQPMLNELTPNTLLAHSDAYPTYQWKLHMQFDKHQKEYYDRLQSQYDLDIDYPQTTIMLYDTNIITPDTYQNLLNLLLQYPISITNDQGIIALYFTAIQPRYRQIKVSNEHTHFYDYLSRNRANKYIMLKLN